MSDRSLVYYFAAGLRVGNSTYTPAYSHIVAGVRKNVSQKLVVSAYYNLPGKANNGDGKSESQSFTFWGGLADIGAKTLSKGKEFDMVGQPNVYRGKIYIPGADGKSTGVPATWKEGGLIGQFIMDKKTSYTILDFKLGNDGAKLIQEEISSIPPKRPVDWNVAGSPGYIAWGAMQKERMKLKFQAGFTMFGYAKVELPKGQDVGAPIPKENTTQAAVAAAVAAGPIYPAAIAPAGPITAVQPAAPQQLQMINAAGGF